MAGAGADLGLDLNPEAETNQSKLQLIPETKVEDKTDATNINLINVSVTLSINNSGNRVSQDQNQQYVNEQQQRSELSDPIQVEQPRLRRVFSSIRYLLRMLQGVLNLDQCRRWIQRYSHHSTIDCRGSNHGSKLHIKIFKLPH